MLWRNADVRYLPASSSQDSGWSLFSATMPPEALEITRKFMNNNCVSSGYFAKKLAEFTTAKGVTTIIGRW
jgi:superfamily II DNA/RNA helicase